MVTRHLVTPPLEEPEEVGRALSSIIGIIR